MSDETKTPDPVEELQAKVATLEADRTAASERAAKAEAAAAAAAEQAARLSGQLLQLGATPPAKPAEPEPAPDFNMEPEKALEFHLRKRTEPLIAEQLRRESLREREMVQIRAPEDWSKYGKAVEDLVAQNRISVEALAQPGSYAQLLQFVKSRDLDSIVKEKVDAELAKRASDAAKSAGSGAPAGVSTPASSSSGPELSQAEATIFAKLGIDPKKAAEASKAVTFDGIRYTGEVVH